MKDSQSSKKKQKNKQSKKLNKKQLAAQSSSKVQKETTVFEKKSTKKEKQKKSPQPSLIKGGKEQKPLSKGRHKEHKVPEVEWEQSGIPKPKPEKKAIETIEEGKGEKILRILFTSLQGISTQGLDIFFIVQTAILKILRGFNGQLRKYETDLSLVLIPIILLVILFIITLLNNQAKSEITAVKLNSEYSVAKVNPYPFVSTVSVPDLSAKAAIITDADSQVVLFSKNPDLRFSMASTTKIMTALVALEYFKLDSVLTVKSANVEGSTIGLDYGDKFYFEDLLYAMMLPSANDAAFNIAQNYPGGVDAFVKKMNEKAQSLHLTNTHFSDPIGLDDDGDYTTVIDMGRLASYAINNKEFTKITSTKEKIISNVNHTQQYDLNNLNKLLGEDGVTGIKTGTTEGAGEVLVTSTIANGHTFIIVVMNSTDRFADTRELLGIVEKNVQFINPVIPSNTQTTLQNSESIH